MKNSKPKKWCRWSGYTFGSGREYPYARMGDKTPCPGCGKMVTVARHPGSQIFAIIPRHKEA